MDVKSFFTASKVLHPLQSPLRTVCSSSSGQKGQEDEDSVQLLRHPQSRVAEEAQPRAHPPGRRLQETPQAPLQQVGPAAECSRDDERLENKMMLIRGCFFSYDERCVKKPRGGDQNTGCVTV